MVKRYYVDKNDAHEHPEGYLVSHEDYAALEAKVKSLFDKIKHGDEQHQSWLKDAIEKHFSQESALKDQG